MTITYPSGRKVNYGYNKINKPTTVTQQLNRGLSNIASSLSYDKVGSPISMTLGSGLIQSWIYNSANRISTIAVPGTISLSYTYDPVGNITSIHDLLDPTKSKTYTYDPLDRLATATGPWGSLAWTYDANGNRLSQSNGEQYKYAYDANRLQSVSNGHIDYYQYDANGNTTHDGQKDFVYNQNQRLIEAIENGKTLAEYTYNGNGQRVIKKTGPANTNSASSQNTVYHYDLGGKLIAETAGNGKMIAEYVYLNGQPLAMISKQANNERMYYYHNDHLGAPQKMTDASGAVVWAADYKPFGEATITVSTITNNLRFPGQYYDAETGLHYNYMRDYNPVIGKYIEADPVGILGQKNHLYVYASNNALINSDPLGLFPGNCGNIRHTWVPDNPLIVFSFDTSCLGHDMCYGCPGARAGLSKEQCDLAFKASMQSVCRFYRLVPALYNSCMALADTYYLAVSLGGNTDFTNARADCCSR